MTKTIARDNHNKQAKHRTSTDQASSAHDSFPHACKASVPHTAPNNIMSSVCAMTVRSCPLMGADAVKICFFHTHAKYAS